MYLECRENATHIIRFHVEMVDNSLPEIGAVMPRPCLTENYPGIVWGTSEEAWTGTDEDFEGFDCRVKRHLCSPTNDLDSDVKPSDGPLKLFRFVLVDLCDGFSDKAETVRLAEKYLDALKRTKGITNLCSHRY